MTLISFDGGKVIDAYEQADGIDLSDGRTLWFAIWTLGGDLMSEPHQPKTIPYEMPQGSVPVWYSFYVFAQRVAWGIATEKEIAAMEHIYELANAFGDWDVCVNDIMA